MDGAKKTRNPHKLPPNHRSDRKSGTGLSGDPKKGGRGGKFTWEGADGYADEDLDLIYGITQNNGNGINKGGAGAAAVTKKGQDGGDDQ